MRARLLGAASGLLVLLAGCGAPSAATPTSSTEALAVSGLTSEELIGYAEQRLVGDCLRRHGFVHRVVKLAAESTSIAGEGGTAESFAYGIDDVDRAEHGLEPSPDTENAKPSADPNSSYLEGLSASEQRRYTAVYFGDSSKHNVETKLEDLTIRTSTTGCLANARKQLYGSLQAWYRPDVISRNLEGMVRREVVKDPRYVHANQDWSACMKEGGLAAADPGALRERFDRRSENLSDSEAHELERRWAVAEAKCAIRTEMTRTARELERHHDAAVREKYRTELDRLEAIETRAVDRARQVLKSQ